MENLEIFQSGNIEQTGKLMENQKYWKNQGISDKYYLLFFSDIWINYVLFAKMDQVYREIVKELCHFGEGETML